MAEPGGGDQASDTNTNRHGALPSEAPTPTASLPHLGLAELAERVGFSPGPLLDCYHPFTHPGAGRSHPGPVEKEGSYEGPWSCCISVLWLSPRRDRELRN